MNKGVKIGIITTLVFALVVVFVYNAPKKDTSFDKEEEEMKLPLSEQKLSKKGFYILHNLMKTFPKVVSMEIIKNPIDTSLKTHSDYPSVYFLADQKINLNEKSTNSLFDFVEKGNAAFVSVKSFNDNFRYKFTYSEFITTAEGDSIDITLTHSELEAEGQYFLKIVRNKKNQTHEWNYFDNLYSFNIHYQNITVLSESGVEYVNKPVFIKIPHGKGHFYIHTIPETFYNESMFSQAGFEYAQAALSNLPKGHYLWHNLSNNYNPMDDFNPNSVDSDSIKRESPIQYILKDVNLRWAYLLLLATLFLYIVFKSKRKQRIIPAIQPNTNSSLEFVDTVGKLYLNQDKHYKFMVHYEQSFLHFIKDRYYLNYSKIDENYINILVLKSDISEEKVKEIFKGLDKAKKSYNFTSDQLIELHKKVEYFYKNCK